MMTKLPTLTIEDDYLIKGNLVKCVDGNWTVNSVALPQDLLALLLATTRALQWWQDRRVIKTIMAHPDRPLPDLDELNSEIPRDQWEIDLGGNPRPPWSRQFVAYFVDIRSAGLLTFSNSTYGARAAVCELEQRLKWMRAIRGGGEEILPLVRFASTPMRTQFGTKMRPDFPIVEWRRFDTAGGPLQVVDQSRNNLQAIGADLKDEVPF
jgi:hypothetical protein